MKMAPHTLLIVDDEAGIRTVLSILLADMGHRVCCAETGDQALEILTDAHPSIVLTDIKMPGMDGVSLLREIKRTHPDVEVIMMTGHGDMDLAVKSLKYLATDFITKPISAEALEVAIARADERISLRNQLRAYTENLELLVAEKSRKLVEAERMAAFGEAVAGLAHTIKNISGGLTGGAFVLEKGIELHHDQYLKQGWTMIKGNVEKLVTLSLDLLNYGKSSEIHPAWCHPNQPAQEIFDMMLPQAQSLGIWLELSLSDELPQVYLDSEAISRCLLNLIGNAIDACLDGPDSPGAAQVRKVTIRTLTAQGWAAVYQIEDTGAGMDNETRQKIFQGFFSTKGSRGTGIGLMTTKKTVEKHHGRIDVISEKGKGTIFNIFLPDISTPGLDKLQERPTTTQRFSA
jgi:signal transduction histidine kinase